MPNDGEDIGQLDWLDDDWVCRSSCGAGNIAACQNPPVDVLRNREGEGRRWFVYPSVV
jgi:hypothetical protein